MRRPWLIHNAQQRTQLVFAITSLDYETLFDQLTRDAIATQIAQHCMPESMRIAFLLACGVPQENIRANG